MGNSWQFDGKVAIRGGGGTWHRIEDPGTGWHSTQTSFSSADSFSDGLEVDLNDNVPAGTRAVIIMILRIGTLDNVYYRPSGDTNISNTPDASNDENSRIMGGDDALYHGVIWLSSDYKFQLAVGSTGSDLYVAYPLEVFI